MGCDLTIRVSWSGRPVTSLDQQGNRGGLMLSPITVPPLFIAWSTSSDNLFSRKASSRLLGKPYSCVVLAESQIVLFFLSSLIEI